MEKAPQVIAQLVAKFREHADHYRSADYKEAQCRVDFIDPVFKALGWDMDNTAGYADAYRDVIYEPAVKIGEATKAPDYCFRVGGTRKFFLEAKKPGVSIKGEPGPAFQLRRYAWSAKLPLSILTDFDELAVYDCRVKPNKDDKSSVSRVFYCTFEDYADRWGEIASIFSREAILKGSFDKYAETARAKRGTAEVDDAFLAEIESWRDALARNIALRNPNLSQRDLNSAVQRTIDRVIFLRICEDRGMEPYGQLMALRNGTDVYPRLCKVFRDADDKYNSGLFHFRQEKGRAEHPDELTPSLLIDDKVLKDILKTLYYPESPYEFSVLPADILGQVYERFLGKVIRLTAGHRAQVEDKPEVRKAGGVYYTPTYIVDYIVKNTVGRLLGNDGGWGMGSGVSGLGCGVSGLGCGVSGLGSGVSGLGSGAGSQGNHGTQDVPGSGGVEGVDGAGGGRVLPDAAAAGRGEIRPDQPAASSGGVDSVEHRGGVRPGSSGGLPSSSVVREGIGDGGRNAAAGGGSSEACDAGSAGPGVGPVPAGGPHPDQADARLGQPPGPIPHPPNPTPQPPGPTPEPLNPIPQTPGPTPHTLDPRSVAKLRILDPACGSGSFLLGAYQYLLDWHLAWYLANDPQKHATGRRPAIYQDGRGNWRLTTAKRKEILLNNIYGVDIDPQAVEVTKLSLLLKVLEGENQETLGAQLRFLHERALPDLGANIKCGNSLIGPDFYDNQQLSLLDEDTRYRINVFDWNTEFAPIMKSGGFDAVIGNPPWGGKAVLRPIEVAYLSRCYSRPAQNMNIFAVFLDLASIRILCKGGWLGFLIPKNFLKTEAYGPYRRDLLTKSQVVRIVDFGQFPQVAQEAIGFFGRALTPREATIERICHIGHSAELLAPLMTANILEDPFTVISLARDARLSQLVSTIRGVSVALGDICHVFRGLEHGRSGTLVFCKSCARYFERPGKQHASLKVVSCKQCGAAISVDDPQSRFTFVSKKQEGEDYVGLLIGNSIDRYDLRDVPYYAKADLPGIDYKGLRELPEKLLFVRIATTLRGYLDRDRLLCLNALNVVTLKDESSYDLRYVLGVLNSQLMARFAEFMITAGATLTIRFSNAAMASLPIPCIDLAIPTCRDRHDRIVRLVEQMLSLHKSRRSAKTGNEKSVLQRQIAATDRQIDQLVYALYGLTDEEIRIVEKATTP